MEQLGEIMNMIDEIKEKINDEEYKNLVNKIKKVNDNNEELYLLNYYEQEPYLKAGGSDELEHTLIRMKRKSIIAKFDKYYFDDEKKEDFIKGINIIPDVCGDIKEVGNLYIRTNKGIPLIQTTKGNKYSEYFIDDPEETNYEVIRLIKYQQFIPISIKKI